MDLPKFTALCHKLKSLHGFVFLSWNAIKLPCSWRRISLVRGENGIDWLRSTLFTSCKPSLTSNVSHLLTDGKSVTITIQSCKMGEYICLLLKREKHPPHPPPLLTLMTMPKSDAELLRNLHVDVFAGVFAPSTEAAGCVCRSVL